jgi:protein O-GlcNAc transferase
VTAFEAAIAFFQAGDMPAAESALDALLAKTPRDANGWNLKGIIAKRTGRLDEAVRCFEQALKIDAANAAALNLARIHSDRGACKQAEALCRTFLRRHPKNAEALATLAWSLHRQGSSKQAVASCRQALAFEPNCLAGLANYAAILFEGGRYSDALQHIERAIALAPADPFSLRTYGSVLVRLGRAADAIRVFRQLVAATPGDAGAFVGLGNAYFVANELEKANEAFARAVALSDDPYILGRACRSLLDSRYGDESQFLAQAHELARRALASGQKLDNGYADFQLTFQRCADFAALEALEPPWPVIERTPNMHVSVLHNQLAQVRTKEDRAILVRLHQRWGARMVGAIDPAPLPRPASLPSRAKLRIGLVSSDLRSHAVSYFVQPIIELYDRSRTELFCYSFYPGAADALQQEFAAKVDSFKVLADASNRAAAETIAVDGIDMLFELGGSTKHNRLELMAYRMAPLQASWLGYPHSSGLPTIDYILVDPYLKPADPALLIEKPLMMPDSWVCLGAFGFPEIAIGGLPADRNGGALTFGTLNSPYKYTRSCVEAWAHVLARVPGSRFLVVRPEAASDLFRAHMVAEFGRHGIDAARIAFRGNVRGQHLALYNEIDIALDAFPQTGGTTTCESLWMGVPVVTLVGDAFFERLSYSNLSNAGLGALCAREVAAYVEIAVALAGDLAGLRSLRAGLRDTIRRSPLGDKERWVRAFEAAVRTAVAG